MTTTLSPTAHIQAQTEEAAIRVGAKDRGYTLSQRFVGMGENPNSIRLRFVKGASKTERVIYVAWDGFTGELIDSRLIVGNRLLEEDLTFNELLNALG